MTSIYTGNTAYPAQTSTSSNASPISKPNATQAFLDYMSKTPEERYYEALLAEEGLTKEQLEALPPEERAKIEEKIRNKMEERVKESAQNVAVDAAKNPDKPIFTSAD